MGEVNTGMLRIIANVDKGGTLGDQKPNTYSGASASYGSTFTKCFLNSNHILGVRHFKDFVPERNLQNNLSRSFYHQPGQIWSSKNNLERLFRNYIYLWNNHSKKNL